MDPSNPRSAFDPSISSSRSPSKMRSSEEDSEARHEAPKRIKMRDLESVFRSEGIRTSNLECSNLQEAKAHEHHSKEEGISQTTVETASMLSDRLTPVTTGCNSPSLEGENACLSQGHVGSTQSSATLGCADVAELKKEVSGTGFPTKVDAKHDPHAMTSMGIGVDLNEDASSMVQHNPFYPYKKLGQVKSTTDASECGSTTGPLDESEPLRMWKEMKQNGFLSSSHGGIPMPKQRGRQSRKRKDNELKKKIESAKREQVNRFTKVAAPSGLLSGLNPGIINHVRNSKQVYSIIEAVVRSEKHDDQTQIRFTDQSRRKEIDRRKNQNTTHDSAASQVALSLNRPSIPSSSKHRGEISEFDLAEHRFLHETSTTTSQFTSEYDDTLSLKLSSAVTVAPENASSASNDDFSENKESVASLSLQAASIASQWLELLHQDIKGRLAALRRSKKRVRNVIQTELPYLLSTELSSNQESGLCFQHSSGTGCSEKATSDMHIARWKSLFSQMDKALHEEGKHLENWLRQVQEMQLHCEKGLKSDGADGLSQLGSSEDSRRLKKSEALERECAVRAAAASIYSTCNFIMTTGNVPCF